MLRKNKRMVVMSPLIAGTTCPELPSRKIIAVTQKLLIGHGEFQQFCDFGAPDGSGKGMKDDADSNSELEFVGEKTKNPAGTVGL